MPHNKQFNSVRDLDHAVEQEVHQYMVEHFYNQHFVLAKSTNNKAQQLSGSDVVASSQRYGLQNNVIDEKSASHHVNNDKLSTFAFELDSFQKDSNGKYTLKRRGWFLNNNTKTDYYLLMWPKAKNVAWLKFPSGIFPYFEKNDISCIEYCLISRKSLLDYLEVNGFSTKILELRANWIRKDFDDDLDNHKEDRGFRKCYHGYKDSSPTDSIFNFFYSFRLNEKPVNLLISKQTLFQLSVTHGTC